MFVSRVACTSRTAVAQTKNFSRAMPQTNFPISEGLPKTKVYTTNAAAYKKFTEQTRDLAMNTTRSGQQQGGKFNPFMSKQQ